MCKYSYNLTSHVPASKKVKLWNSLMQSRYVGCSVCEMIISFLSVFRFGESREHGSGFDRSTLWHQPRPRREGRCSKFQFQPDFPSLKRSSYRRVAPVTFCLGLMLASFAITYFLIPAEHKQWNFNSIGRTRIEQALGFNEVCLVCPVSLEIEARLHDINGCRGENLYIHKIIII